MSRSLAILTLLLSGFLAGAAWADERAAPLAAEGVGESCADLLCLAEEFPDETVVAHLPVPGRIEPARLAFADHCSPASRALPITHRARAPPASLTA